MYKSIKDGLIEKTLKAPTYTVKEIVEAIQKTTSLTSNLAFRNALDLREIKERLGIIPITQGRQTRSAMGAVWSTEEEDQKDQVVDPSIWVIG